MRRWAVVLLIAVQSPSPLSAQDIQGLGRNVEGSPIIVGVTGHEGDWWEPQGIRIRTLVHNVGQREIAAYEVFVLGLNPFNVIRLTRTITKAVRLDPGKDREDALDLPYLGKRDIFTVMAVVTKVRFASGEVWAVGRDSIRDALVSGMADLDLSAVLLPDYGRRLQGTAGAYVFLQLTLSPGWSSPTVDGDCTEYLAEGPSSASMTLEGGVEEYLATEAGDRLIVCEGVVHVVPGGTPRGRQEQGSPAEGW